MWRSIRFYLKATLELGQRQSQNVIDIAKILSEASENYGINLIIIIILYYYHY